MTRTEYWMELIKPCLAMKGYCVAVMSSRSGLLCWPSDDTSDFYTVRCSDIETIYEAIRRVNYLPDFSARLWRKARR